METPPRFFRDFTWVNRGLLALCLLLLGLLVSARLTYRGWLRQYWGMGVCSRQQDALTLLAGDLLLADDHRLPLDENLMHPDTDPLCTSCDQFYPSTYTDASAFLLPPRVLSLQWASLPERRFYRGVFTLPQARIDSLFDRYRARPDTTWHFLREPREYDPIGGAPLTEGGLLLLVRLAPGGRVSLSVLEPTTDRQGQVAMLTQELAHFQAAAYQPAWHDEPTYDYYYHAKTPQAYLDTLVARRDSSGRMRPRRQP